MKIISSLIIFIGIVGMLIVPSGLIEMEDFSLFNIPPEITAFFVSIIILVVGFVLLYVFHYRDLAKRLDGDVK